MFTDADSFLAGEAAFRARKMPEQQTSDMLHAEESQRASGISAPVGQGSVYEIGGDRQSSLFKSHGCFFMAEVHGDTANFWNSVLYPR